MKTMNRGLRWTASGLLLTLAVAGLGLACNENPVTYSQPTGAIEIIVPTNASGSQQLDMLWVVDDSGSMCQEQKVLRENFDKFIGELQTTNLDFHLGLTTTDMREIGGNLVNVPNPIPGADPSCLEAVDASGNVIQGDYSPIRDALQAATACLKEGVDATRYNWSDEDIRCAVEGTAGCTITGVACTGEMCDPSHLFPPADAYRPIPKVIRSAEYELPGGALDVARLKADFGCMSLVGASGWGLEAGLAAAITAVSPDMTGGPAGAPEATPGVDPTAPNHGFIRQDARFALVFVTDENDCSIDPAQEA